MRGAYSEAALLRRFGPSVKAVGFAFSEQVFDAVEEGRVDAGFVPVENSIAGSVGINADLLLSRKVFATGEEYFPIEHCLLGLPGENLANVKTVRSHPIALAQCHDFLKTHGLRAVPEYDTAGAAEIVAQKHIPGEAAIASKRCADIYGLTVLSEDVQSAANNITRFLAFCRENSVPNSLKMEKTSLAFSVRHKPGALLDCLRLFSDHRINLSKLESRPISENPFEYYFFIDIMGGQNDPEVKMALSELKRAALHFKIIGSYPLAERP